MSSTERMNQRINRLDRLSEHLFGEPGEVEYAEAEELLKTAGIDPSRLKDALYQRMSERSEKYRGTGKPLPLRLRQALEDLRPGSETPAHQTTAARTARVAIARLLEEIQELPTRLSAGFIPEFSAAYRNRTELSARDKEVLDEIMDELREQAHG